MDCRDPLYGSLQQWELLDAAMLVKFSFGMLWWIHLWLEHFKNGGHSNTFYRITAYQNRRQWNWLVSSYKYVLLIANYAPRNIQRQSVQMLQQRSFFPQQMISFNVGDKRWPYFVRVFSICFDIFVLQDELALVWVCVNHIKERKKKRPAEVNWNKEKAVTCHLDSTASSPYLSLLV